jgi:hypothetical protein
MIRQRLERVMKLAAARQRGQVLARRQQRRQPRWQPRWQHQATTSDWMRFYLQVRLWR